MIALSVRQPWAWLIVHGHKDIENRSWWTRVRGRVLIHAGKAYTLGQHREYCLVIQDDFGIALPRFEEIERGGIVGAAHIVDCVREHPSRWKDPESYGFVLARPEVLPFRPCRGELGFFEVLVDVP